MTDTDTTSAGAPLPPLQPAPPINVTSAQAPVVKPPMPLPTPAPVSAVDAAAAAKAARLNAENTKESRGFDVRQRALELADAFETAMTLNGRTNEASNPSPTGVVARANVYLAFLIGDV